MPHRMQQYSPYAHALPLQPCPWCGSPLNALGQANSPHCEVPEAGDVTVCMQCVQVSIFRAHGHLRRARPAEIDAAVRAVQDDIRRTRVRLH